MTLQELQNLDPNNIGSWPAAVRGVVILVLCAAVLGAGFYFDTKDQLADLDGRVRKEGELKKTFEAKQRKAVNLKPLQAQLKEMKQSFGALLRLLPNKTEIEGLLVDISQSGLAAGLEFELFKPGKEKPQEFYAIQPITIKVTGNYHQFGEFISSVSALPRIVTQHDISMVPVGGKSGKGGESLTMNMTAKTYRYLEEEEIEKLADAKKSKGKKRKRK